MHFNSNLAVTGKKVDIHEVKRWKDLENTLNYNMEFGSPADATTGNPGSQGNIKGKWVTVTTPSTPNTDFVVTHNLGSVPAGIDLKQKSAACDVYNGSQPHTTTTATLRATTANTVLTLFVH